MALFFFPFSFLRNKKKKKTKRTTNNMAQVLGRIIAKLVINNARVIGQAIIDAWKIASESKWVVGSSRFDHRSI